MFLKMNLFICSFLLLLPVLLCGNLRETISAVSCNNKHCHKPNPNSVVPVTGAELPSTLLNSDSDNVKDMLILGTDGFMGYVQTDDCWNISQSQSPFWCNSSGISVKWKLFDITVFSFKGTNGTDFVSLSEHTPYRLNISRSFLPTYVCVIEGNCTNASWTHWIAEKGCNWNPPFGEKMENCSMTCLNPLKSCETAVYDPSCRDDNGGDDSKMNTIGISNGTATCFKCGSPFQKPEELKDIPPQLAALFNNTGNTAETDAKAAVAVMSKLGDLVSGMGNLTTASITLGSVTGVLKKIQSVSDIKKSGYIYSSKTGLRLIDDFSVMKDYGKAFTVPEEATLKAFNKSAGNTFLGVFRFPNMSKDENNSTVLGDEVYAIDLGTHVSNLTDNISLTFSKEANMNEIPLCHSWDGNGSKPNWTTEGCVTVLDGNKITCNCNHLTFFAVLMGPVTISQNDLIILTYITYIGCGLSMFFLGVALFIHVLLRKSKATVSAHVLMNLFLALFLLNLTFLSNEYVARANSPVGCKAMAAVMHYCLLASFSWFAVEALHLCLQISKGTLAIKHYILKISVLGWVPPAVVVSVIFSFQEYGEQITQTDTSNVTMCWILDSTIHYAVNIGYYSFVFIFTFCTCIVVLRWLSLLKVKKWSTFGNVKGARTATFDITTIMGLCCLLGLTWSFTFFSFGALRVPSYYVFTILNSFQGLFLFIYYVKTSILFGDPQPAEQSSVTEDNTENPYVEELPTSDKKAI